MSMPVAARSKSRVCTRWLAGIGFEPLGMRTGNVYEAGWALEPVWTVAENLAPWDSIPESAIACRYTAWAAPAHNYS